MGGIFYGGAKLVVQGGKKVVIIGNRKGRR